VRNECSDLDLFFINVVNPILIYLLICLFSFGRKRLTSLSIITERPVIYGDFSLSASTATNIDLIFVTPSVAAEVAEKSS